MITVLIPVFKSSIEIICKTKRKFAFLDALNVNPKLSIQPLRSFNRLLKKIPKKLRSKWRNNKIELIWVLKLPMNDF